jgi:hypothetical protein
MKKDEKKQHGVYRCMLMISAGMGYTDEYRR